MTDDQRDSELFGEIQKGSRAAFNQLFLHYYQALCRYSYSITNHPEESEELVSDVFFTIWTKAKKLTIEHTVRVYLYSCVKHASLARLKSTKIKIVDTSEDELTNIALPMPDAQREMEYADLEKQFKAATSQLPEKCREVFMLARVDGLRYKEISLLLNISEKTVENHLAKALSLMRQSMAAYKQVLT